MFIALILCVFVIWANLGSRASDDLTLRLDSLESQEGAVDYSKFKHDNSKHARLHCLLCHRRETNAPRPTMPAASNHLPCTGCHAREFANSASSVCTICHTDVQSGALKPFPPLTSFGMRFDHARHLGVGKLSCATCHRPSRGGVALSIPSGFNAHVTCYQCHGPRAKSGDRDIASCGVWHQPGRNRPISEVARAFRIGFSHREHDQTEGLNCTECHRVQQGVSQSMQVTAPQPLNHHASARRFSCMSCHNGNKAFGGDDFSVCKRCHSGSTWRF